MYAHNHSLDASSVSVSEFSSNRSGGWISGSFFKIGIGPKSRRAFCMLKSSVRISNSQAIDQAYFLNGFGKSGKTKTGLDLIIGLVSSVNNCSLVLGNSIGAGPACGLLGFADFVTT